MSFGIYVHIPYCLQRCTYCDFATYIYTPERKDIMPPEDYLRLLKTEIETRSGSVRSRTLDTVYFGGGTPSLLKPEQIDEIMNWIREAGFKFAPDCEITIEMNPATLSGTQMESLLNFGINRFSVGLQTLADRHLDFVKRKHSSQDTLDTVKLIKSLGVNFSLDLLFALPHQTLSELDRDLDYLLEIGPPHISSYCMTVEDSHVLSKLRPMDEVQLKMFELIHERLGGVGYERYEISNYSLPGKESRHNSLHWDDQPYWGVGLSAHSYDPKMGDWGTRFWNPSTIKEYEKQNGKPLPPSHSETLTPWESLTDYCHTSLRRLRGLSTVDFQAKFGTSALQIIEGPLKQMQAEGLVSNQANHVWSLTPEGVVLSNQVFQALTCLESEWKGLTP